MQHSSFQRHAVQNPKLAKFYACLQALALNKDDIEDEEEDNVFGDEDGMREYAAALLKRLLQPTCGDRKGCGRRKKRKADKPIDPVLPSR